MWFKHLHFPFSNLGECMKKIKPKDRVQIFLKDSDDEYIGTLISFTKYGVSMDYCFYQKWAPVLIPWHEIKLVLKVVR